MLDNFTNGLEQLQPETITVKIKGEEMNISPFKFKQFLRVIKLVSTLAGNVDVVNPMGIFAVISEKEEIFAEFLALCTGKPKAFFDDEELGADEIFSLGAAIWKVNESFFYQKVVPELTRILGDQFVSQYVQRKKKPEIETDQNLENLPANLVG